MAQLETSPFADLPMLPSCLYEPVSPQLKLKIRHALEASQKSDTTSMTNLVMVAYALKFLGNSHEAASKFLQVQELGRNNSVIALQVLGGIERGMLVMEITESEELEAPAMETAITELQTGIQLAKDHPEALRDDFIRLHVVRRAKLGLARFHFLLGRLYVDRGISGGDQDECMSKAEKHLKACTEWGGGWAEYYNLGSFYFGRGKYRDGMRELCEAARLAREEKRLDVESRCWRGIGTRLQLVDFEDKMKAAVCMVDSLKACVHDPGADAKRLWDAQLRLSWCIRNATRPNWGETAGIESDEYSSDERPSPELRASGYHVLAAAALIVFKDSQQASELIHAALSLLEGTEDKTVLFRCLSFQANVQSSMHRFDDALGTFQRCSLVAPSEKDKVECYLNICMELGKVELPRSAMLLNKLLVEYACLLETEWCLKARVLVAVGEDWMRLGNFSRAVENLEAARAIWEANEGDASYSPMAAAFTYKLLCHAYNMTGQMFAAFDLVSRYEAFLGSTYRQDLLSELRQLLHLDLAGFYNAVADRESCRDKLSELLAYQDEVQDSRLRYSTYVSLGNASINSRAFDEALDMFERAEQLIPADQRRGDADIHLGRAAVYANKASSAANSGKEDEEALAFSLQALEEFERVVELGRERWEAGSRVNLDEISKACLGQAVVLLNMGKLESAASKLENAFKLMNRRELDPVSDSYFRFVRAKILQKEGRYAEAIVEARKGAMLLVEYQKRLRSLKQYWVTVLDGVLKMHFSLLQMLLTDEEKLLEALVWAERSRTRLYFHLADQHQLRTTKPVEKLDPFDEDDDEAARCILEAVQNATGERSVVVEFTYTPHTLYVYVVRYSAAASGLDVHFTFEHPMRFFRRKEIRGLGMGGTLEALVRRTRAGIHNNERKAKIGLGILYKLLLEPVWELLEPHDAIIFVPDGILALVPFAALYDAGDDKFLVQKKKVTVVPSLRVLRRCQMREREFNEQPVELRGAAFVAGDPEPMGLKQHQLPHAREEAEGIAGLLGVRAVVGSELTKELVTEQLRACSGALVLATHGVVNSLYPNGALVMQSRGTYVAGVEKVVDAVRAGDASSYARETSLCNEQVVSASEIEEVEGGVQAGLVVLSACQTGDGEVSSEGFGLGRSVLQAGAVCAIVTLWKVHDRSSKELMLGMFKELVGGQSIASALRSSMLDLIQSGYPIKMWAPAVAFGSSSLRLQFGNKIPELAALKLEDLQLAKSRMPVDKLPREYRYHGHEHRLELTKHPYRRLHSYFYGCNICLGHGRGWAYHCKECGLHAQEGKLDNASFDAHPACLFDIGDAEARELEGGNPLWGRAYNSSLPSSHVVSAASPVDESSSSSDYDKYSDIHSSIHSLLQLIFNP